MGQAAAELKDYAEAYQYFKLYLKNGREKIDESRRDEVQAQLELLEGNLASIKVRVVQDDAEITIDGVVVGASPLYEAVKVSAGRRKVVVSRKGFLPWERKIDLAGRDSETVNVDLVSLTSPARDENAPNPFLEAGPVDRSDPGLSRAFWTSATITALLAGGTGFFAIQTYRSRNIYDEQLALVPNNAANIRLAGDDLRQFALLTDISLGLTVVGAISTVLLARRSDNNRGRVAGLQMQLSPSRVALVGEF
jgi:formate-dependent phosphoribosylglycinamide formyltransferase (GAR transformylase)